MEGIRHKPRVVEESSPERQSPETEKRVITESVHPRLTDLVQEILVMNRAPNHMLLALSREDSFVCE